MKRDRVAEVENSKLVKNGEIALTVTYDIKNCSISQLKHEADKIIKQILRSEQLVDKKLHKKLTNR